MIQLHRLEGFYWVVRAGGYAKAARAFPYPITQPAVHQQVKKLETELDLTLLERIGRDRMQPTPAGQRLFDFVAPFFEQLPGVLRSLQRGEYGGKLTIYAEAMFLRHLLPPWIKRLHRKHKVQVELRELAFSSVAPLHNGDADLLVAWLPEVPDDIASQTVATLYPFVVMPKDHPIANRSKPNISDLRDTPFVAYHEGIPARELQMAALARHGVVPGEVLSTSTADSILGFVEAGLGYSLIPHFNKSGPKSRGIIARPLTAPKLEFDIVAAWRKDTPENPLLDAALEVIFASS